MNDQHTPKLRIEPTGPDWTTLILQARDEVLDDPEISHGAARMFMKILDLSVRQGSKGVDQPPGVVTISQTKLAHWFDVSLRTIWNWKLELLQKGVVWMTSQPMPNAWPIDTYHITHLHPRKHSGDKTTAEGLWGNGARQRRPENLGMGARQPGQAIIPGTGTRSNQLRVATGFQDSDESSFSPDNATAARNRLPASAEAGCGGEPKPVAAVARNPLRRLPETDCDGEPKPVAAVARNPLRRATEPDCEHKKAKGQGSSQIEGGAKRPTPPDVDKESAFKNWERRLDDMRNSDLRKLNEVITREYQSARSEPAKATVKRKLVAIRLRLLGPSVPDEPGPVRAVKPTTPPRMPIEKARELMAQSKAAEPALAR